MRIISGVVPGVSHLVRLQELSKKARQRLKWFDYYNSHGYNARLHVEDYCRAPRGRLATRYHGYIIGDKSDGGQDASLRIEMGNSGQDLWEGFMVVKAATMTEKGMKRFKEARDKGSDFLAGRQRPDGSFQNVHLGAGGYWGIPIALFVGGHSNASNRLCDWVRKNAFTPEGDIGPAPEKDRGYEYPYLKSWLIEGTHRLAQFDLSQRGMDFLAGFWDPESGGFFSSPTERSPETKMDLWVTSGCARAALYTGRLDIARGAARWMKKILELQPNYPRQLFSVYSKAKGLYTEPDPGEEDFRFSAEEDFRYVLNQDATRDQSFFHPGIIGGFLARLYQSTGEKEYLELAKEYMRLAEGASDYLFRLLRAGKTGWAAAVLYTITGEQKYKDMAVRIGDNLIALQSEDGYWSGVGEITETPDENMSAEMVIWLDEIYQAVGHE